MPNKLINPEGLKMQEYYLVDRVVEPKVIGVRDGCAQADIHRAGFQDKTQYDRIMEYIGSYDSFERAKNDPAFNLELQYVKLKKSAKATDFMRFAPVLLHCPFLVSEKVKSILEKFKISSYYMYDAHVYTKENHLLHYYLFFCRNLGTDFIDFKQSILHSEFPYEERNRLPINSSREYLEFNGLAWFHKIILNHKFDNTLDAFKMVSDVYVSQKLRDELEAAQVTGVRFLPATGPDNGLYPRDYSGESNSNE